MSGLGGIDEVDVLPVAAGCSKVDEPAMPEIDERGREGLLVDAVVAEHGGERRREPRRRARQEHRVVDQRDLGVAPALPPGPQEQPEDEERPAPSTIAPSSRLNMVWRPRVRVAVRLGDVVDVAQAREQGAVDVALVGQREHLVVDDGRGLVLVQVALEEARAGVEVDLAVVLAALVHVEQDDEAVVDALPADAPGVHDRHRVRPGGLGRDVEVVARPGHDRELRLGPGPDRLGDRLGLRLRGRASRSPRGRRRRRPRWLGGRRHLRRRATCATTATDAARRGGHGQEATGEAHGQSR